MIKIATAQLNFKIGDFETNNLKIIDAITKAKTENADLIIFSELAIGGYAAKDLWRNRSFMNRCQKSLQLISSYCHGIACIIGCPTFNTTGHGKPLHNSAICIENGKTIHTHHKNYLPDYDVFDEHRYFEPGKETFCFTFKNLKIALTVCEDLWDDTTNNSYDGDLLSQLVSQKPDLLINIAASPFSYIQHKKRLSVFRKAVQTLNIPLIYVNQLGGYADLLFDGFSCAVNENGEIHIQLPVFEEKIEVFDFPATVPTEPNKYPITQSSKIALIHQGLIFGVREYFSKNGFEKAILGLSGGLDSALVAALACEALGSKNVLCVLMPSMYSSIHSIKDAQDLVTNTGCRSITVPINGVVSAFDEALAPIFKDYTVDVTEENIQARSRAVILMALANKFGHIPLNTSNKSEAAVGYGTLYGDMAGALSVIGDIYKTEAYELAKYINRDYEVIPNHTIVKPPSAELRLDQKDSDSLPTYEVLDDILFQLIEAEVSSEELVRSGYDEAIISRVTKLLTNAEFKRNQSAPTLRVSPKSFGSGRQYPLVANANF